MRTRHFQRIARQNRPAGIPASVFFRLRSRIPAQDSVQYHLTSAGIILLEIAGIFRVIFQILSVRAALDKAVQKEGFIMDKVQRMKQQKQYEDYVKKKTPRHNVWLNMLKAFLLGGTVCFLGQVIYHYCEVQKLAADECSSWTSLMLVLFSVLLTGTGIYPRLAKWGGAGALVPITGFANSVAAPAIEYKKEGQVFGIGCKIFTIAGPVILYGIFTSWALGFIYWVWTSVQ